ncbi:MAG: multidrug ABC transporter permease [Bacteroidetes bacterium HGW-Bacteroidetes-15]|nr:MAG: multidrug ABC transporter permease [Bacteroidetes bacterium HGW-Bacteroidetes-15]
MKSRFVHFAKKEFLHIFRDIRTLIIIFGIPIVQLLMFGYVITNEIKDVKVGIYNPSGDYLSQELITMLTSSGYFIPEITISSEKDIEPALRSGKIKMVISISPQFAQKFYKDGITSIQLITDATEPNTASLLTNYASAIINEFANDKGIGSQSTLPFEVRVRMLFNQDLKAVFMFVPGTMALILMLITAMMTSISIAREKELGTMEVLLVSPLKPVQIILGKVFPYIGLAFANSIIILLLGYTVFGLPIRGSLILLLAVCFLFILLALSLGILISTVVKTQQIAMFFSMIALMLPTILLSGFVFPVESMPKVLQWFSVIIPPRWFISALKTIMLKGEGFALVWKEMLIMFSMSLFFILVSIKKFKERLE